VGGEEGEKAEDEGVEGGGGGGGGGGDLLVINGFKFCFQNFLLTKWNNGVYYQTM